MRKLRHDEAKGLAGAHTVTRSLSQWCGFRACAITAVLHDLWKVSGSAPCPDEAPAPAGLPVVGAMEMLRQ